MDAKKFLNKPGPKVVKSAYMEQELWGELVKVCPKEYQGSDSDVLKWAAVTAIESVKRK